MPVRRARISQSAEATIGGGLTPIDGVSVFGYKSIANTTISLTPLTLLAGPNSSGKSSLLQPILLVKQTLEAAYDPGSLLLDGPYAKFTDSQQLFTKKPGSSGAARRFAIRFYASDDRILELTFSRPAARRRFQIGGSGLDIQSVKVTDPSLGVDALAIRRGLSKAAIAKLRAIKSRFPVPRRELRDQGWDVTTRRCFLEVLEVFKWQDNWFEISSPINDLVRDVEAAVSAVIYLPGLRGNPERVYPRTPVGREFPGEFQAYVASVIDDWQVGRNKDDRAALSEVANTLEELGLTWRVETRAIGNAIELSVGRLPHSGAGGERDDLVNIADVGLGTSQILPVLVALRKAVPGQIVLLEQPEIHLHPRAQGVLAGALVRAARRGVRVVAETHSSLLLRGVQTLIARGDIDSNLVSLHWFTRDPSTGLSRATTAKVDEFGRFPDWPVDFDEVAIESETDYLDAVEDRYRRS